MNLNKLFPRLSIRVKLGVAFVLLAIVPLLLVSVFATRITVRHVRALATANLEHDLEIAERQTGRSLRKLDQDVRYLTRSVDAQLIRESSPASWEALHRTIAEYLEFNPVLFQLKVADARGRLLLSARNGELRSNAAPEDETGGVYYALRARSLRRDQSSFLPVELRGPGTVEGQVSTVPTIAMVLPVRDSTGELQGVVVGEAFASLLFAALDNGSSGQEGVTGLVGADGLFLYHSAYKRDWASLLASRSELDLEPVLPASAASAMLSGQQGTVEAAGDRILSFVPIRLSDGGPPLMMYREIPLSVLDAPVRSFLRWVALGALALLATVLGLAALATHQIMQPILQLRLGVRRLAAGLSDEPLHIQTNDELEDLAEDFSTMAATLASHRNELEELVRERTAKLREADAELEGILDHSADAIVGLGLDNRVRVWNRGAERLFGYAPSEATGRDVSELIVPDSAKHRGESVIIAGELADRGAVVNLRTTRHAMNGELIPVSLTQTVIRDQQDRPFGQSLIIRDIRLQNQLEEQLRRSDRLATVSVMAAGLAHELNNPLAVIANRIECMEQDVEERCNDCFLDKDLTVLREHTARLLDATRELLAFGQDESNEMGVLALNDVVGRVAVLLEKTYSVGSARLEVRLASSLPNVHGSEQALETVCMNLLMNAIDATGSDGLVTVETQPGAGGDTVQLEVRDTGAGVPPDLRERIFEPFFTTKTDGRGTGLGLTLCRRIVERHGGKIWVESASGGGSLFRVSLPIQATEGFQWA